MHESLVMTNSTIIPTRSLLLRTVTMDDVDRVARSWRLDGQPLSRSEAEHKVETMLANHRRNAEGDFVHLCLAIVHQDTGEFIGWCGLDHRDRTNPAPVLFYLLKAAYRGRGLATEAARALLDYAFAELAQARIEGYAALENVASKRVMEKIGMRLVGEDDEVYHFAIRREKHASGVEDAS
jgi:RimJ/RimL family protein N-acetyltransferase